MQTVGALSSLPVVRDFRLSGPVAAGASAAALPQDQVKLGSRSARLEPTALPLVQATAGAAPAPLAVESSPQLLVDLDGQLGQPNLSSEARTATPAGSNPAVLTQFDPQSGNQVRIDQQAFQDTLALDLGGPASVTLQHVDDLSELNGRLPSPAELSKLTAAFYDSSRIPFEYIQDGCYARAHLMCESLRQQGINHSKVFVFGSLGAKNDVQQARWWYHVAPMVFVQDPDSGAVDARVLDPALSREPMSVADWVQAVNRGDSVRLDLTRASQYTPRERSGIPLSFEQNLGPAQNILKNYSNALTMLAPERQGPVRGGNLAEGQSDLFPQGLPEPPPDIMGELTRLLMASEPGRLPVMPMMAMGFGGMIGGMMGFGMNSLVNAGYPGAFRAYGGEAPPPPPWMVPPKPGEDPMPTHQPASQDSFVGRKERVSPLTLEAPKWMVPPESGKEHVWPGTIESAPPAPETEHVWPPARERKGLEHLWPARDPLKP